MRMRAAGVQPPRGGNRNRRGQSRPKEKEEGKDSKIDPSAKKPNAMVMVKEMARDAK